MSLKGLQKAFLLKSYVASDNCRPTTPSLGLHPGKFVSVLCQPRFFEDGSLDDILAEVTPHWLTKLS